MVQQKLFFSLSNKQPFPVVGLGTYRINSEQAEATVYDAVKVGYRLIDTAAVYRNEQGVGRAINRALDENICSRSDIFVTTPRDQGFEKAMAAFDLSLSNLNLSYMDCYLIHWPGTSGWQPSDTRNPESRKGSWDALEQIFKSGKSKSIGISNYTIPHMRQLLEYCNIRPHLLQTEFHPCLFDEKLLDFCRENSIQLQAYSSLGEGAFLNGTVDIPGLDAIAAKHKKSKAQVLLKWALQHDIAVIPKSTNLERLLSNIELFDFHLDDIDMAGLDGCKIKNRFCWDPNTVC